MHPRRYAPFATVLVALLVALGYAVAAGGAPPAPSYDAGQARKGQTVFYEQCAECHGGNLEGNFGPALAGGDGNIQWDTVKYVYTYMTGHMPAGNAGGLSKDEYVDLMSFLLKMHGHAPGKRALTEDAAKNSKALLGL